MVRVSIAYTTAVLPPPASLGNMTLQQVRSDLPLLLTVQQASIRGLPILLHRERNPLGLLDGRLPSRVNLGTLNANYRLPG